MPSALLGHYRFNQRCPSLSFHCRSSKGGGVLLVPLVAYTMVATIILLSASIGCASAQETAGGPPLPIQQVPGAQPADDTSHRNRQTPSPHHAPYADDEEDSDCSDASSLGYPPQNNNAGAPHGGQAGKGKRDEKGGANAGVIIGAAVGAAIVALVIGGVVCCACRSARGAPVHHENGHQESGAAPNGLVGIPMKSSGHAKFAPPPTCVNALPSHQPECYDADEWSTVTGVVLDNHHNDACEGYNSRSSSDHDHVRALNCTEEESSRTCDYPPGYVDDVCAMKN